MAKLLILLLVSCSSIKPLQRDSEGNIDEVESSSDSSISINEEYNPQEVASSEKKIEKIHLSLIGKGPSSIVYIGLLKSFENKRKKIGYLSGKGWGSLIAALYAKYAKVSMVEWVYFKYFNKKFPVKTKDYEDLYKSYEKLLEVEFKPLGKSSLKISFNTEKSDNIYHFLVSEMKKAEDQSTRGLYWEQSQNCSKNKETAGLKQVCAKISSAKKPVWDYERIVLPYPVQDLSRNSLTDLIARGKKFSDNNLRYLNY